MLRRLWPLAAFTSLYALGFSAHAVAASNTEFIFYALVMLVIMGLVMLLHRRVHFSLPVLWGLSVWGLLHMAGGNVPIPASLAPDWTPTPRADGWVPVSTVLYNFRPAPWLPKFDQFVHAFGFFVATLASFQALRANTGCKHATPGMAVSAMLMGVGLGALNEVVEFTATRFMATNVGGYVNTGWDLVSNLVGAAAAAVLIWLSGRSEAQATSQRKCPAKDSNLQPSD